MAEVTKLSWADICNRVKQVIGDDCGRDWHGLYLAQCLLDDPPDPLHYTVAGVRDLAPKLNTKFSDCELSVTRPELKKAKIIRHIAEKVNEKLPAKHKEG